MCDVHEDTGFLELNKCMCVTKECKIGLALELENCLEVCKSLMEVGMEMETKQPFQYSQSYRS